MSRRASFSDLNGTLRRSLWEHRSSLVHAKTTAAAVISRIAIVTPFVCAEEGLLPAEHFATDRMQDQGLMVLDGLDKSTWPTDAGTASRLRAWMSVS